MDSFKINNYARQPVFAGFLPGIAGKRGIPVWCCYVNRGQAVASFGSLDKDHAILEFSPMNVACREVGTTGFRTFLKYNGGVYEPFQDAERNHGMEIGLNYIKIWEKIDCLDITVKYFTLPDEKAGALVRELEVQNTGHSNINVELLDGLACLVPYGVGNSSTKQMGQTSQAWMRVEDAHHGTPYFRVRASMDDTISVREINEGNFAAAVDADGNRLPAIIDPAVVFGYDTSLKKPVNFIELELDGLLSTEQIAQNRLPCCFFGQKRALRKGGSLKQVSLFGQAETKTAARAACDNYTSPVRFSEAYKQAVALTNELTDVIASKTGHEIFDAYCRQTYLDNFLRGGVPVMLGRDEKPYYIYSRKHGDLERDYNFFRVLPEYYSCGNGNFRDVNQNRRCDVLFEPKVGRANIKTFFDLLQLDGYNPLVVDGYVFVLDESGQKSMLKTVCPESAEAALKLFKKPFTPGRVVMEAENWQLKEGVTPESLMNEAVSLAKQECLAQFGEGYWSDHWTYNLDLIESYLSVFPENEAELLFEQKDYLYFEAKAVVLPRAKRYAKTAKGIRQYKTIDHSPKKGILHNWVKTDCGKGETACSTLMEKLVLLCAVKYATLDPYGIGVEMEGGKPGWYDALNGLPGLLGSSVNEACELGRTLEFVIAKLKKHGNSVEMYAEQSELVRALAGNWGWDSANDAKELYREKTIYGVSGERKTLAHNELTGILSGWLQTVLAGIERGKSYHNGICPAYFYYEVTEYTEDENGLYPKAFKLCQMPLFLEGPVRWLRLGSTKEEKLSLHNKVKNSGLYDKKLNMFKVNESLKDVTYEVGRATSFTPGWLENESIWLHMEYKYLLELLRSGLYAEFAESFRKAAIPFLDPKTYGRSTTENSSFIASSANPDPSSHGRGFVARLSGSTAEFLSIWQLMLIGPKPVSLADSKLSLVLNPFIPDYLMPDDGVIEATLFGNIKLEYHTEGLKQLIPGEYRIKSYSLYGKNGQCAVIHASSLNDADTLRVRNREIDKIVVLVGGVN